MPAISATAPGKIILFGEHAVVYGRPALAIPVMEVKARAVVTAEPRAEAGAIRIKAPQLDLDANLSDLPPEQPLAAATRLAISSLAIAHPPAFSLRITSTIPMAAGMGSGAAVSVAAIRAVSAFMGKPLPDERVCELAYEVEKLYHGAPSGIDNTTVTYARPVYFVRGAPIEILSVKSPFTIVIGDTGVACPTSIPVGDVRRDWEADPARMERLFDQAGEIAREARRLIESGHAEALGLLMNENHDLLADMGVSSPELDVLVETARSAGALGAKLSGGGRGGNMIALAPAGATRTIEKALAEAGATNTIITEVRSATRNE